MKSPDQSFDDALDAAIDGLRDGQPLDAILAAHAPYADQLRPLLDVAVAAGVASGLVPDPSTRLASNFTVVRGELRRGRTAPPATREQLSPRASWRRPWAVASLSLPVSTLVVAFGVGVSGAAAAAVIAKPDLPTRVADAVHSSWAGSLLSGTDHATGHEPQPSNPADPTPPTGGATSATQVDLTPAMITVSGVVNNIHGNEFALRTGEVTWSVSVAGTTRISGRLQTGASATVSGSVSAGGTVDADEIRVTAPDAMPTAGNRGSDATPGNAGTVPGAPTDTPTPPADSISVPPTDTPGSPAGHTPGPPAGHTPGPPTGHTPSPPASHTPPGQGNGKKP